jgi:hypothetical protein
MTEISVPWPTAALTPEQWRRRVTDLAEMAESMIGKRKVPLQQQADLALWWAGLCWSGFGAETIAASCRASLLLGENVVMAADPATQLVEVAERLDHVWEMAQADPSAAVATVLPPLIDLPPTPGRRGRPRPTVEQEQEQQEQPDTLEQEQPDTLEQEPTAVEQEQQGGEHLEPEPTAVEQEQPDHHEGEHLEPEPAALEPRRPARVPIPPGWFTAGDLAELVEISETTLSRWRKAGRCGEQGTDWRKCGRQFYFSPDAAEQLMQQQAA